MGIKKCTNDLLEKLVKPFKKCSYCEEHGHTKDNCKCIWCYECHKLTHHCTDKCPRLTGRYYCEKCGIYSCSAFRKCSQCHKQLKIK